VRFPGDRLAVPDLAGWRADLYLARGMVEGVRGAGGGFAVIGGFTGLADAGQRG
jgi:hypothetical protein